MQTVPAAAFERMIYISMLVKEGKEHPLHCWVIDSILDACATLSFSLPLSLSLFLSLSLPLFFYLSLLVILWAELMRNQWKDVYKINKCLNTQCVCMSVRGGLCSPKGV